jgi:hypothetical protein
MNRWTRGLVWLALLLLALGAWAGWGHVILTITPDDVAHRVAFLALLFLALFSTLTFPAYLVTDRLHRRWPLVRGGLAVAVRQGALGALFVVICAGLQMIRSLTAGHIVLVLSTLLIVEIFLQVRQENPTR